MQGREKKETKTPEAVVSSREREIKKNFLLFLFTTTHREHRPYARCVAIRLYLLSILVSFVE